MYHKSSIARKFSLLFKTSPFLEKKLIVNPLPLDICMQHSLLSKYLASMLHDGIFTNLQFKWILHFVN